MLAQQPYHPPPLRGGHRKQMQSLQRRRKRHSPARQVFDSPGPIDGPSTKVMEGNFAKLLSWYDNETGYSSRVADLAVLMGKA